MSKPNEVVFEGYRCPSCFAGHMEIAYSGPCTCLTVSHPPCPTCNNDFLVCDDCGFEITAWPQDALGNNSITIHTPALPLLSNEEHNS